MGVCCSCNRKGFLLSVDSAGLCKVCAEAKRKDEMARMAELNRQQAEKLRQRDELVQLRYNDLISVYNSAIVDVSTCALVDISTAIPFCDRFLQNLIDFAALDGCDKFIQDNAKVYGSFVELPSLGYVQRTTNPDGISFSRQISKIEACKKQYESILSESNRFAELINEVNFTEVAICDTAEAIPRNLSKHSVDTKSITKRTPVTKLNTFIVIDTETTGLSPIKNEIIQLSAVKFVGFQPVEAFSTYIRPREGLNQKAQEINHIGLEQVQDAPYFEEIKASFIEFIGDVYLDKTPIVGHNISFDLNFLASYGVGIYSFHRPVYDTLELARKTYSLETKFTLDFLGRNKLSVIRESAHNAISDCLITGMLFSDIYRERTGIDLETH